MIKKTQFSILWPQKTVERHVTSQFGRQMYSRKTYEKMYCIKATWHILGDRLIPLASLSLVGFYM